MISRMFRKAKQVADRVPSGSGSAPSAIYPSNSGRGWFHGVDTSPLLYRYGVVVAPKSYAASVAENTPDLESWLSLNWLDWEVTHHPELRCVTSGSDAADVLVLGEIFNPFSKQFDSDEIAAELCKLAGDEGPFLDYLDELSGRYLVLVSVNGACWVYNDAYPVVSVFYNERFPGFLASHASLLAAVTRDEVDFNVNAFVNSPQYRNKDVKYLPGNRTMYQNTLLMPANHRANLLDGAIHRYWPHKVKSEDVGNPTQLLIDYLDGYSEYIVRNYDRDIFGLTGGMDCRALLAALASKGMPLTTYTLYRGDQKGGNDRDCKIAKSLSESLGLEHHVVKVNQQGLKGYYFSEPMQVVRRNTGYARLNSGHGHVALYNEFSGLYEGERLSHTRGFGGGIMSGFYQGKSGALTNPSAKRFSDVYAVLPGSPFVRACFEHFHRSFEFNRIGDVDINDIFYWEHRMTAWGAMSLAESDITAHSHAGYNARKLYRGFLNQAQAVRKDKAVLREAVRHFKPELLDFPVE